uniref:Alpha-macroglobulin receptor-binding domain-containing protein n=1 Tax=Anopheles epiroticus TaxID=199890 RepID=A0A182P1U4_9DIPT
MSLFSFREEIHKIQTVTNAFLKIELRSPWLNKDIRIMTACNKRMIFMFYYVVSKGNIVDAGVMRSQNQTKIMFSIKASEKMIPRAILLVATVVNKVVIWDSQEIDLKQQNNNIEIRIDEKEVKPGREIELQLKGRPSAYVGLAAYDKGLLEFSKHHDMYWEDVMQVFNDFYAIDQNQFDPFHSMGLFASISGGTKMETISAMSGRFGNVPTRPYSRLVAYRTNFLESWLWQNVTIGRSGKRQLIEVVPDTTTSWYLTGFSIDPVYGLDLSYTKAVSVPPKVGVPVSFLIKARKLGELAVRVKASIMHGHETDAIEKVIRVMSENIIIDDTITRYFNLDKYGREEFTLSLDILKKANFSTVKLQFIISPNPLSTTIHNLDSLITIPSASGAPSMINFIPNLVVLDYLRAIGSNATHLIDKARGLLQKGYQIEVQYRQRDGSFGNWRNSHGSVFVTALVGQAMEAASKHISEVDATMVDRMFEWLASKQHTSGRFNEEQSITYHTLQGGSRNGVALTSFVLIAFLENTEAKKNHKTVIRKGIEYIASQLPSIKDVYDLSLATYALILADHHQKSQTLRTLIKQAKSVNGTKGMEIYWERDTSSIETTAYGLLSLVHEKRYVDGICVMNWLANRRSSSGSFPRTQDTFVGLKAMAALSDAISPQNNDYSVTIQHGRAKNVYKVTSAEVDQELRHELPGESKMVTLSVDGRGFGLFMIAYQYEMDVKNINKQFNLTVETQFSDAGYRLQLRVCTSFIPDLMHSRSNLALVEVNFPSGFIVIGESVLDETQRTPFKNVELRYGHTSLVVYYESLGPEWNCFTVTANRLFRVAFHRSAYVLVHDAYNRKYSAIREYEPPQDTFLSD